MATPTLPDPNTRDYELKLQDVKEKLRHNYRSLGKHKEERKIKVLDKLHVDRKPPREYSSGGSNNIRVIRKTEIILGVPVEHTVVIPLKQASAKDRIYVNMKRLKKASK